MKALTVRESHPSFKQQNRADGLLFMPQTFHPQINHPDSSMSPPQPFLSQLKTLPSNLPPIQLPLKTPLKFSLVPNRPKP